MRLDEARNRYPGGVISIRRLAREAGVSANTIWRAEAGLRIPSYPTVLRISRALGIKPEYIDEFRPVLEEVGEAGAEVQDNA